MLIAIARMRLSALSICRSTGRGWELPSSTVRRPPGERPCSSAGPDAFKRGKTDVDGSGPGHSGFPGGSDILEARVKPEATVPGRRALGIIAEEMNLAGLNLAPGLLRGLHRRPLL